MFWGQGLCILGVLLRISRPKAQDISVSADNAVFIVDGANKLKVYNKKAKKWEPVKAASSANQVAVEGELET